MHQEPASSPTHVAADGRPPKKLRELFGIDWRALVVYRVGMAALLIADLIKRSLALRRHYTGEGVYPRDAAMLVQPDSKLFHVYLLSDRLEVQVALFCLAGLIAFLLLVGYRTKLMAVLSLLFLISIQRRNIYACHTGDAWLTVLVFWLIFLPVQHWCSIDRLRKPDAPRPPPVPLTVGTVGVLLQICAFYVLAGILKHQHQLWVDGDALHVFANIGEYTRPFGAALADYPRIGEFLTYATLVIEGLLPFLFFVPFWTGWIRTAIVFVFLAFHLGIQLSVYIGIFEVMAMVAVLLFLPTWFWDRLERVPLPRALRSWGRGAHAWLARVFGPRAPGPAPARSRPSALARARGFAREAVALVALAIVLISNYNSAVEDPVPLPQPVVDYGRQLGLVQRWEIFNDMDRLFFGWLVVIGQQEDGRIVDFWNGGDFRGVRVPEHFAATFPNHNDRRFWTQAAIPVHSFLLTDLARYVIREWNRTHPKRLLHAAIYHGGRVPGKWQTDQRLRRLIVYGVDPAELPPEQRARAGELRAEWLRLLATIPEEIRRPDAATRLVLARTTEAMGGREAWDATRHVHWRFFGQREHWWDKHTGDVRIEDRDLVVLMNVESRKGRAFRGGVEVTDPAERTRLLEQGYAWWVNDSYWLVMPWKLEDPGVELRMNGVEVLPDGEVADVLELSFSGVGLTPLNRYLVAVSRETGLVAQWSFFRTAADSEPLFTLPWAGWERFGRVLIATDHGRGADWDVAVADELPPSAYTDPAPVVRQ